VPVTRRTSQKATARVRGDFAGQQKGLHSAHCSQTVVAVRLDQSCAWEARRADRIGPDGFGLSIMTTNSTRHLSQPPIPADAPAINVIADGDVSEEAQKPTLNLHGDPCMASRLSSQAAAAAILLFNSDRIKIKSSISSSGLASPAYQSNFRPNWICREVVDVEVITPAVGDGVAEADAKTTAFGDPKLVRLNMLKNSARN
jgi:hypothetical protein